MYLRRLLLAALVAMAATAASAEVSLIAPQGGERLEGGRDATLWWSSDVLPPHAEEWEAFLSIDGGAYYAVRITPHLDTRARSFRWRVPNVATSQARLLLRIGDEKHEHVIRLPQTFTIVPRYAAPDLACLPADHAGEAAVEGGQPSVEWVSSDLIRHTHRVPSAGGTTNIEAGSPLDAAAVTSSVKALRAVASEERLPVRDRSPVRTDALRIVRPLLLLTTRLNV